MPLYTVKKTWKFGKDKVHHILLVLKVLSNEKRGRLKVVSVDRSRCKLFMLRFSKKSQQRPKTTQRGRVLLLFEYNNGIQFKGQCHKFSTSGFLSTTPAVTGGVAKFASVLLTPVTNLPPVSFIPVFLNLDFQISPRIFEKNSKQP